MYMKIRGFVRNQFRKLRRATSYTFKVMYTTGVVLGVMKIMEMLGG